MTTPNVENKLSLKELGYKICKESKPKERFIVGIVGPPGSGKTTVSKALAENLDKSTKIVPMDGFHLDNKQLRKRSLLHRKGAPETFDSVGFINLVTKLRRKKQIFYPKFDRKADRTLPKADCITEATQIILLEGNYLLLKEPPWSDLKNLIDCTVWLEVNPKELQVRLINRWIDHGMTSTDAYKRVLENDMLNILYVLENSAAPDVKLDTYR